MFHNAVALKGENKYLRLTSSNLICVERHLIRQA